MSIGNRRVLACVAGASVLILASAGIAQETVQHGYDALGRVVTVTYGNGAIITYAYDAAGNRTEVTSAPGGGGGGNLLAVDDLHEVQVGTTMALTAPTNDSDPNGNLHVSAVTTPTGGTAAVPTGGASVTYVAPGTPGTYAFGYTANDGQGGTATASVEVFVKYGQAYCNQFPDDPYC